MGFCGSLFQVSVSQLGANLIPQDWSITENVVYYQDFVRGAKHSKFQEDLVSFLGAMGLTGEIIKDIEQ
jgi:hypothetical protein